jgi:hypothetical protein
MAYGTHKTDVYPAVKSASSRTSQRFPIGTGIAKLPVSARRQSARTSTNGTNPPKGVGTLKGSGLR